MTNALKREILEDELLIVITISCNFLCAAKTVLSKSVYRIAGNFRLEKIFTFFAQARRGRKFFRRIILPSENFVTLNFLHVAAKLY